MIPIYRNTILLNTKNNYPQPGNDIIERAELACKLGSFPDYRLILMTAPAGYGKTSFLASWADKANASPEEGKPLICWFSVEEEENRQTAFFDYLFNAFYHHSGLPDSIKAEAERMFGGCASFNRQHLIYFINDASNLKRDILIIIDDIHLIDNPGIFITCFGELR